MNVYLLSHFRDAVGYIERYAAQVGALHAMLEAQGDRLFLVIGEGDSTDDTRQRLIRDVVERLDADLLDVAHGGPVYGSMVHPERFRQLAGVCNALWACIPRDADVVLWVESDLIWNVPTMLRLIDHLRTVPVVAPKILHRSRDSWYDVWAFRQGGQHFHPSPPYLDGLPQTGMVQIESAGSVLAMRGNLARVLTWPDEDVIVGLCRQAYQMGGSVWCDMDLIVEHP